MNRDFISGAWQQLCDCYVMERRQYGEDYVLGKWKLSKTRLRMYCHFSKFCKMCRENNLPLPPSPDVIQLILSKNQSDWMMIWRYCVQENVDTYDSIKSLLQDMKWMKSHKQSNEAIQRNRVKSAAKTLAGVEDPVAFVDKVGPEGLGKDWVSGVHNAIEMDQRRMDLSRG